MNRVLSIAIALFLAIGVIAAIVYFLSSQVAHFSDSLPAVKVKFKTLIDDGIAWVSSSLNVKEQAVLGWLANARAKGMEGGSSMLSTTLTTIGGVFAFVFLLPVYIFLILFYKPLLLEFIARSFGLERHEVVGDVLVETRTLVQSYLVGLLLEAVIVVALNCAGLLIIGIDYAILLSVIGALLNVRSPA